MQNAPNGSNQQLFRSHSQGSDSGSLASSSVHQTGKSRTWKHIPGLNRTVSSTSIHSQWNLNLCRTHPHPIISSPFLPFCSQRQNNFLSDLMSFISNSEMKLQAQNNEFGQLPRLHIVLWAFALYFRDGTCFFRIFQIEAMPKWRLGYPLHGQIDEGLVNLHSLSRSSELLNIQLRKLSVFWFPKRECSHLWSRSPPMWWQQYQCNQGKEGRWY